MAASTRFNTTRSLKLQNIPASCDLGAKQKVDVAEIVAMNLSLLQAYISL